MLPWPIEPPTKRIFDLDDFSYNLISTNFVSTTSNIVFTRKLFEKIGAMRNLRFVHDWDFLLRAARFFRCELIEKPLLQYRVHQTNTISSNRAWMLFEICWIYAVHLRNFTNIIFSESQTNSDSSDQIKFLSKSINLQGNDKVMWMLMQLIDDYRKKSINEEKIINDEKLRSLFIQKIKI
jgi:hypothetical protein